MGEVPVTKPAKKAPLLKKARSTPISKLNPDSKGVTCTLKVLGSPKLTEASKSNDGRLQFWEVTCGNDTGKVVLSLMERQKDCLADGQVVVVRNGNVKMVNGFIRLTVDKWGKLDTSTEEVVERVGDNNISTIEYELK